jgi:hypothetical protein
MNVRRLNTSAIQEKMVRLLRLIQGGKVSDEKRIDLEMEYCFLQREFEFRAKTRKQTKKL